MTTTTFADAEARLASSLPGYESRPQQTRLAEAIETSMAAGSHLMAEAGCGVGKSLGALIPALQWAVSNDKRVVYSTATKALQDQIAGKDVPFLQEHLGLDFSWALLKGRSNYVCMAKMAAVDEPFVAEIFSEMGEDHDGDVEGLTTTLTDEQRRAVTTTSDECPGRSQCPFGNVCLAEKAKERARSANLVVVNHALLAVDLQLREKTKHIKADVSMLKQYDRLIADEGHELEEIFTSALGDELRQSALNRLAKEITNFASDNGNLEIMTSAQELRLAGETMFDALPQVEDPTTLTTPFFLDHEGEFTAVVRAASDLADQLTDMELNVPTEQLSKASAKRKMLATRTERLVDRLTEIMLATGSESVRWVEPSTFRGKKYMALCSAPLDVSGWLQEWLWSRVPSVVMSATLSTGNGDFSYLQGRVGLQGVRSLNVGTPFSYDRQSLMYVPPAGTADPKSNRQAWLAASNAMTQDLVDASKGGALLLFTSRSAMLTAHRNLSERFSAKGYTVLLQGAGVTNRELGAQFKADNNSVLFALKSFMTGVDFQGDTCRLVVIDKLPFPVPTDIVFQARCAEVDRRAGRPVSFRRMSIPVMTLLLTQAFGRLIRSKTDRGVVAILDSRLVSTPYGRGIVGNLPDCQVTFDLADVQGFYA